MIISASATKIVKKDDPVICYDKDNNERECDKRGDDVTPFMGSGYMPPLEYKTEEPVAKVEKTESTKSKTSETPEKKATAEKKDKAETSDATEKKATVDKSAGTKDNKNEEK